jgi:GNAT superfamily N-acetyltransferase
VLSARSAGTDTTVSSETSVSPESSALVAGLAAGPAAALPTLEVRTALLGDPAAAPLLEGLLREYTERYGPVAGAEFARHPAEVFTPEHGGALVLLVEAGETVAGGAFRRLVPEDSAGSKGGAGSEDGAGSKDGAGVQALDPPAAAVPTAEFKRIWTHDAHRRRGLARRVLAELELRATRAGYARVYLSTGPRQPEAVALYRVTGYAELPDPGAAARGYAMHPFVKLLDKHL